MVIQFNETLSILNGIFRVKGLVYDGWDSMHHIAYTPNSIPFTIQLFLLPEQPKGLFLPLLMEPYTSMDVAQFFPRSKKWQQARAYVKKADDGFFPLSLCVPSYLEYIFLIIQ